MSKARTPMTFDDGYLPLDELATYSGLSRTTLEEYLNHVEHPLPYYRFGTKITVRRSEYDAWARTYRVAEEPVDIKALVDAEIAERR